MNKPESMTIMEVGPRDGLQNEAGAVPLATKLELLERLAAAGLTHIEAGSFVRPDLVPQMADSEQLFQRLPATGAVKHVALVPNMKGFSRAVAAGAGRVAVFTAASETFSIKNTGCSIARSLARFAPLLEEAARRDIPVRGYVSCAAGCPYEGPVAAGAVAELASALYRAGCSEICLADTIGTGTPGHFTALVDALSGSIPVPALAVHCHNSYGQALANIYASMQLGVAVADSSIAGLGGCPFAPAATGNVATEDLVFMLQGMQLDTGIDLDALIETGNWICSRLGRENMSNVARARSARS